MDFSKATFLEQLKCLQKSSQDYEIFECYRQDSGTHPVGYEDIECAFAAQRLHSINAINILDIGSYRHFILGLLAHYHVTTIDIRDRNSALHNEVAVTCDAKDMSFPINTFDAVISLCAIEHMGLGRYGDDFDPEADIKVINKIYDVLKPGGFFIFSTTITQAKPAIAFNAHRIYSYNMIHKLCQKFEMRNELFYSRTLESECTLENVTSKNKQWDVYCGCWEKWTYDD